MARVKATVLLRTDSFGICVKAVREAVNRAICTQLAPFSKWLAAISKVGHNLLIKLRITFERNSKFALQPVATQAFFDFFRQLITELSTGVRTRLNLAVACPSRLGTSAILWTSGRVSAA